MFQTIRSRLLVVVSLAVALSAAAALITWISLEDLGGSAVPSLQRAAAVVATVALAWIVAVLLTLKATRPLGRMVQATRELVDGRHPDEAFEGLGDDTELLEVAAGFRKMAMRVREVDSSDRRFLMSISHELRTPLTAITGHAQALEDGIAVDEEARNRSLAVIVREAARLERLVEDIIDLAKLRSNRFTISEEYVDLAELGEHLLAIFNDQADSGAKVPVRGDFEHVQITGDGQRILQVLRNLTTNALRYAATEVKITVERVRGRVRITVFNDGRPVPEEMHEKMFEPFVGTKNEGGMGLGLAIGRELCWAMGGNLRCVPTTTGALFEITLPLEPPGSGR